MVWEKRLFRTLLFFLPTQLALHLWPAWAYLFGIRIDYLSPTVYFTDLIIIALLAQHFVVNKDPLGINKWVLLAVGLFVTVNTFFSLSPQVTLLAWGRLALHFGLGVIVYREAADFGKDIPKYLGLGIVYILLIAVAQFVRQRSIGGALYWIGERQLEVATPGVAKESLLGELVMRPYATFPHPNAMAGYALLAITLIYAYSGRKKPVLVILAGVAIILISFSQVALVASLVAVTVAFFVQRKKSFVGGRVFMLGVFGVSMIFSLVPGLFFAGDEVSVGIGRRMDLNFVAGYLIGQNYIAGIGLNNFTIGLSESMSVLSGHLTPMKTFWLQPVHNVFLLVFAELGAVGVAAFMYLLTRAYLNVEKNILLAGLVAVVAIGMADHYWITLQQTRLLFVIFIAMGLSMYDNKIQND